jgi:hypothetical protein
VETGRGLGASLAVFPSFHVLRMPTETPADTPNWTGLEGTVLEGGYEIENCLHAGESSASFKVRVLGDRFTNAVAQFFAPGKLSPEEFQLWRDSVQLRHPNLSPPLSAGELESNGAPFPYRVLVKPDETLGDVILARALTPAETREVLGSVANALEFLHGNGFTHSVLAPDKILAIGDSVKLTTTGIRRINTPVNGEEMPSPAMDVFRLGATLFEVLTQKPCEGNCRENTGELPYPFNDIVRRCLDPDAQARCTLPEVRTMLARRAPAPPPPPPQPEPVQAAAAAPVIPVSEPLRNLEPSRPRPEIAIPPRRERFDLGERPESSPFKKSAYLLLALLLAVGVLWLARPKSRPSPTVNPNPAAPVARSSDKPAGTPGSSWPTRAVGPARSASRSGVADGKAPAAGAAVWRVVSFTYSREDEAKKKAEWVESKYPGFHPEVFSPSGKGSPYVVTLGGRMNREDAILVRQKARAVGLPRDSYIQNYRR